MENDHRYYSDIGLQPIPLLTNSKQTDLHNWPSRPVADLWQEADRDPSRYANIGLRAGAGVAIIDADNEPTVSAVSDHLSGLGLTAGGLPVVRSWQVGRRHFYLSLTDAPLDRSAVDLSNGLGGELRFGNGAYCVAPHSVIDGRHYELESGSWLQLPRVTWQDLTPLLSSPTVDAADLDAVPVPLLRRDRLPRHTWHLLNWLTTAERGMTYENYASRSEVEFAVLLSLIRSGRTYNDAAALFGKHQPRHYKETHAPQSYLARSWRNAVSLFSKTTPRPALAEQYHLAQSVSWRLDTDRRVYTAVLSCAYEQATVRPSAAQRDLALLAGVKCRKTVGRSLDRLIESELLMPVADGREKLTHSNRYEVVFGQNATIGHSLRETAMLSYGGILSNNLSIETESEVWRELGGSCRSVWAAVAAADGVTDRDLAETVGKHVKTVRRALSRLQADGLVTCGSAGRWSAVGDLAEVADRRQVAESVDQHRRAVRVQRQLFGEVAKQEAAKRSEVCHEQA